MKNNISVCVQVNGITRGRMKVIMGASKYDMLSAVRFETKPDINRWLFGKRIIKKIVVPGKLINLVVSE